MRESLEIAENTFERVWISGLFLKVSDEITCSVITARHLRMRTDFAHFVEILNYQHRGVSCQLHNLMSNRVATLTVRISGGELGTVSFMAPELLYSAKFGLEKGLPSKEADIYALGMTVYQVLTGKWPFYPKREARRSRTRGF